MPQHVPHNDNPLLHLTHVPHSAVMVADGILVGTRGRFTPVVLASGPLPGKPGPLRRAGPNRRRY
jgi:hypothetical protein